MSMNIDYEDTPVMLDPLVHDIFEGVSPEKRAVVESIRDSLAEAVMASTAAAVLAIVHKSNLESLIDVKFSPVDMNRIQQEIQVSLQGVLRLSAAAPNAELPYQTLIPAYLKLEIDSGEMGLVQLSRSDLFARKLPRALIQGNVLDRCVINSKDAMPLSWKRLRARVYGIPTKEVREEHCSTMSFRALLEAVSPVDETGRFDLATAVMTLRRTAVNCVFPVANFLYFDSPQNNLAMQEQTQYSTNGSGFVVCRKLIENWNAMISEYYRNRGQNDKAVEVEMKKLMYTAEDGEKLYAVLSRMCNKHPERVEHEAELFRCVLRPGADAGVQPERRRLYQHVSTIHTQHEMDERLEQIASLWDTATSSRVPPTHQERKDPPTAQANRMVLRDPKMHEWAQVQGHKRSSEGRWRTQK